MKEKLTYDKHDFFLSPNSSQTKRKRVIRIDKEARKFKALELHEKGLTHEEISEEMFINKTTVHNYIRAAKCLLYDRIKEKFKDITHLL